MYIVAQLSPLHSPLHTVFGCIEYYYYGVCILSASLKSRLLLADCNHRLHRLTALLLLLRDTTISKRTPLTLQIMPLFPYRCISSLAKPRFSLSQFTPSFKPSPFVSRRFFYGYISDSRMAPQLEPFFKQYEPSSLILQSTRD